MAAEKRIPILKCSNCGKKFVAEGATLAKLPVIGELTGEVFNTSGQRACVVHDCKDDECGLAFVVGYKRILSKEESVMPTEEMSSEKED